MVVTVLAAVVGATVEAVAAHRASDTTRVVGGAADHIVMVRSLAAFKTNGGTWKTLPGATTHITVAPGHSAIVLARFTGGFFCAADDGSPTGICSVRILIGSAEGQPATGTDLAVAGVIAGQAPGALTAAVDRSRGPLSAGTYPVVVRIRTSSPLIGLEFDSWHLTVERIDAGA